jgi:hypothetical protein
MHLDGLARVLLRFVVVRLVQEDTRGGPARLVGQGAGDLVTRKQDRVVEGDDACDYAEGLLDGVMTTAT